MAIAAVAATVASCSGSAYSDTVHSSSSYQDMLLPTVTFSGLGGAVLEENAVDVQPGAPVVVTAAEGALTDVRIDKSDGTPLKGVFSEDGTTWTSAEPFGYNRTYTVNASALGVGGQSAEQVSFTTTAPSALASNYVTPMRNSTVGVGQPVGVKFDTSIPDRQAAQDAITVTTDPPVEGAFYWISNSEVRWRPAEYWPTGTKVKVEVNTYGIDLGNGIYGSANTGTEFTIGRSMIATVDDATKMVTFTRDGRVIRTMPTSLGKDSTPTPNGVYLIGDQHDNLIMDSSTYGVPSDSADGYVTPVDYATQMSYSGIYFHAAPWSLWAQGNTNTSHGCLNLSHADAKWVMDETLRGDPVIVKNTVGETLSGYDGLGDWNIPWEVWKRGNA